MISWTADCQQMFKVASFYCTGLDFLQFSLSLGLRLVMSQCLEDGTTANTSPENIILLKHPFPGGHVSRMTNFPFHLPPLPPPQNPKNFRVESLWWICVVYEMKNLIYYFLNIDTKYNMLNIKHYMATKYLALIILELRK